MTKTYKISGCKAEISYDRCYVERTSDDEAEFWGVYVTGDNGLDKHVADFNEKPDAELFARAKQFEGNGGQG